LCEGGVEWGEKSLSEDGKLSIWAVKRMGVNITMMGTKGGNNRSKECGWGGKSIEES